MKTYVKKLDFYVPLEKIWENCHFEPMTIFLDSSFVENQGRYSILGRNPYEIYTEEDGICYKNGRKMEKTVEAVLDSYIKEHYEENSTGLPLISGALGYFSYEKKKKFEQLQSLHKSHVEMPDCCFVFYDNFIIEDCLKKEIYITASGHLGEQHQTWKKIEQWIWDLAHEMNGIDKITQDLKLGKSERSFLVQEHGAAERKSEVLKMEYTSDFTKDEYLNVVRKMMDYIREGDIYIANMSEQLHIKSQKSPFEVYRYLRIHNPSPFGAYMNLGETQIVCSSPERFLKVKDGQIETRPIKGTRKRGETRQNDERLYQELKESEKERSELLMIVDLERNDLNRICVSGSVNVTKSFEIESYATVSQQVSTIVGTLKEECSLKDILYAMCPGGSIAGAPKIRAMEIIEELERSRRGIYTGTIGYLSMDCSLDLNIVIRTAVYQGGQYHLGVGGGITFESETEAEYDEILQKAKAVLEAINDTTNR